MPPTPKPGSLKKVATEAVKKAIANKVVKPTTNKIVKATVDSTAFYKRASESFMRLANDESKKGNDGTVRKLVKLAKSFSEDQKRQSKKGTLGYDKNGFPLKKNKVGGIVKSKKK